MIKIQLCPAVELENKRFWVVDLGVLVVVAVLAWSSANTVLDDMRTETSRLQEVNQSWIKQLAEVQPSLAKFKNLDDEIKLLNLKIAALKKITVSKIDKVLPIVVFEQIQTLTPRGIWIARLKYTDEKKLIIRGGSRDSLLISEYLMSLRETMNPETYTEDVRTQLGFNDMQVKDIRLTPSETYFQDIKDFLDFETTVTVVEKQKPGEAKKESVGVAMGPRSKFEEELVRKKKL